MRKVENLSKGKSRNQRWVNGFGSLAFFLLLALQYTAKPDDGSFVKSLVIGSRSAFKVPILSATPYGSSLFDGDKDLLPDSLEWVTLSDPTRSDTDRDGFSDFLEVVNYSSPRIVGKHNSFKAAFRVLVNLEPNKTFLNQKDLWAHCLFHVPIGGLEKVLAFSLFVDVGGIRYPLAAIMNNGLRDIKESSDGKGGKFIRLSYRFSVNAYSMPGALTISGVAIFNGRVFKSGSFLSKDNGAFFSLVRLSPNDLAFQSAGKQEVTNPFWHKNRVCVFKLDTQAIGGAGVLCEVVSSKCQSASRLRCAPNCLKMKGLTFILPDGLGVVVGG